MLKTGAGIALGVVSWSVLSNADRLLLTQFVSQTELGLYSIANKLATMAYVLLSAVWNAWWPLALEMAAQNRPDAPRQFSRLLELFVAGSAFIALAIGVFATDILGWFTRAIYIPAAPYALMLLIYYGPMAMLGSGFQIGLYATKRTQWITVALTAGAVSNIAVNWLVLPRLGVWGAILATLCAGLVWLVCLYGPSQRSLFVPYRWGRLIAISCVYVLLVSLHLLPQPLLQGFLPRLATLALFAGAIVLAGIVSPKELRQAYQAMRQFSANLLAGHPPSP